MSEPRMYFSLEKDKEPKKSCQSFDIVILSEFLKFLKYGADIMIDDCTK